MIVDEKTGETKVVVTMETEESSPSPKTCLLKDIEDLRVELEKHAKRKPEEPDQLDCCDSGCTPCIFDTYYDQLERHEKR